jgi:hypothetical protein
LALRCGAQIRVCDHPWMNTGPGERGRFGAAATCVIATALALVVLSGCASTSSLPGHGTTSAVRLVGQDGPPADPSQVAVVRRWAAALRAGNIGGAAGYFHLPSFFDNGVADTITLRSTAEARAANSTLPCGAVVISAFRQGRFIDVLFRLTARAGQGGGERACGAGIGQTARTRFLIHNGQIVAWVRAPSLPGDPGVPGHSGGSGGSGGGGGNTGSGSLPA